MDILLVEDDLSLQLVTRDFLEDNGYSVEICGTGSGALELINQNEYKLIVLDINLPDLIGFDICGIIRRTSNVPIIFLSARISDMDKIRGLDIGGDDYIMKPYSLNELLYRIKAQIRRKYDYDSTHMANETKASDITASINGGSNLTDMNSLSKDGDIFRFGRLVVDFQARRVSVGGEEKLLPPKEFDLLAYLIKNKNKSISKEILFDMIWGYDSIGEINTLSVHIRRLREKIEEDPSSPKYIKTIWGIGFRFEV